MAEKQAVSNFSWLSPRPCPDPILKISPKLVANHLYGGDLGTRENFEKMGSSNQRTQQTLTSSFQGRGPKEKAFKNVTICKLLGSALSQKHLEEPLSSRYSEETYEGYE